MVAHFVDKVLLRKIALRLKALRKKHQLTQSALYEDTGINISRIERGVNDLSVSTLNRLCVYFEITLEEFFRDFEK